MKSKCKVCVAVPIHKDFSLLTRAELRSLTQLFQVLSDHEILLFGPDEFNWLGYTDFLHGIKAEYLIRKFANNSFKDIEGYNKLLTSPLFFYSFKEFDYLLIYQLDAFVFRNELEYWCRKDFDYIGAPWFEGFGNPASEEFIGSGNGGFSLRKISVSLRILKRINLIKRFRRIWFKGKIQSVFSFDKLLLIMAPIWKIKDKNQLVRYIIDQPNLNEDYFWAIIVPQIFHDYIIASPEDSVGFSFEVRPSYLFKLNNYKLPFGCHAWEKYEPEFWVNHIVLSGSEM